MTHEDYHTMRVDLGVDAAKAAKLLGLDVRTIERREKGKLPVTREAELAIILLDHCINKTRIINCLGVQK